MLHRTFQFLNGIGPVIEKRLWRQGIHTWDDALQQKCPQNVNNTLWRTLQMEIPLLKKALVYRDINYLKKKIPDFLQWRMIPHFIGEIAYLDIESTGGNVSQDYITTISVFDGKKIWNFIKGQNIENFIPFISQFPVIATFFGKTFDIPFIEREFHITFHQIHFDLCFLLRKIGFHGGLKRIEHRLGLNRGDLEGIDGSIAIKLWQLYQNTEDERFLDTLVAYNSEDVVNLEFLLYYYYNQMVIRHKLPFSQLEFSQNNFVRNYRIHKEIIQKIRELL